MNRETAKCWLLLVQSEYRAILPLLLEVNFDLLAIIFIQYHKIKQSARCTV